MNKTFNKFYASIYDDLYQDKAYSDEVGHIVKRVQQNSSSLSHSECILDFGCGTGNHALEFYKHGFSVTGVDPSVFMIEIAKGKILPNSKIEFLVGGIENVALRNYNLVTCLFNVLGYYSIDNNPLELFAKFNALLLEDRGHIVIDFWEKSKIQSVNQGVTTTNYITKLGVVSRTTSGKFAKDDVLEIDIGWAIDGLIIDSSQEKHFIKVFSSEFISESLKLAGFKDIQSFEPPKGLYVDSRSSTFIATASG